jgi:hypothetical protein
MNKRIENYFFKIMNFVGLYDLEQTLLIVLLNHRQSAVRLPSLITNK